MRARCPTGSTGRCRRTIPRSTGSAGHRRSSDRYWGLRTRPCTIRRRTWKPRCRGPTLRPRPWPWPPAQSSTGSSCSGPPARSSTGSNRSGPPGVETYNTNFNYYIYDRFCYSCEVFLLIRARCIAFCVVYPIVYFRPMGILKTTSSKFKTPTWNVWVLKATIQDLSLCTKKRFGMLF